jgi:hypothetical protein
MATRKGPKPTAASNAKKGRSLHSTFLKTTKNVKEASNAFSKQSESLLSSISKAIESEDQNLVSIEKQLKALDKKALDFKEKNELLISLKTEAELKSKALVNLSETAENNVVLTTKLLKLVEETNKDSYDDLIVENVAKLAEVNKYLESLKVEKEFDTEELLEHFGKIIDKKKLDKIEKRIELLDNYLLSPAKNIGLFSNLTDMIAGSIFGPLGKPLADALNLNTKLESNIEKIFKGSDDLKEQSSKYEKLYEKLKAKLDESNLPEDQKDLILRRSEHAEEREQEIEIDRTQDFRAESLHLARRTMDKADSSNFGVMQILSLLTGGKLVKGLAAGLAALLGGGAIKGMLSGGLGGGIKSAGGLSKIGSVAKLARGAGLVGALTIAGEAGWEVGYNRVGKKLSQKYKSEINDAVWWAVEEAPEKVRKEYMFAKEAAAKRILEISTSTFNSISNVKTGYESLVQSATKLFTDNSLYKKLTNNKTQINRNTTNSNVTNLSNKAINYRIPSVESFPMQNNTLPNIPEQKESEKKPDYVRPVTTGKISSDDIPMFTSDKKLLLLTTGNL